MSKDKKTNKEAGVEFLTGLSELLPEEKRKGFLESVPDKALEAIGEGVKRQSDYSRAMDEVRDLQQKAEHTRQQYEDLYSKNVAWLQTNKSELEKIQQLQTDLKAKDDTIAKYRKRLRGDDDDFDLDDDDDLKRPKPPEIDVSGLITKEAFDQALAGLERDALSIIPIVNKLTMRHYKDYGEILDSDELFKHAQKTGLPLGRAYEDMTKDTAKTKQEDEIAKKIEAARQEGLEEGLKKAREGGGLPYVVANNEPRTMDGLNAEDKSEFGVEAAVNDYYRAETERRRAAAPPSDS